MSKPTAKRPGSARGASPKIRLEDAGRGMSSQAGLVPVVKFLDALGFGGLFGHHVESTRARRTPSTNSATPRSWWWWA